MLNTVARAISGKRYLKAKSMLDKARCAASRILKDFPAQDPKNMFDTTFYLRNSLRCQQPVEFRMES
eukprot:67518-Amphidinium_carterae.1